MLLVTAYDLDDETFDQLSSEWTAWWESVGARGETSARP